jgi:glycosyltransferase involved in cell wall biosynthesis
MGSIAGCIKQIARHRFNSELTVQDNPLITFILFGYNQAHFVREAIDGALTQNYSPLEIIFSDDCSTDQTFEIMSEMAANYKGPHKIILNRNEQNRGVGAHVNRAFSLASGEWIVTAASDDISDPDRCARVLELAKQHPDAGAIGLGWRDIDEKGDPYPGVMLARYKQRRRTSGQDRTWLREFASGDFGVWGMSAAWSQKLLQSCPPLPDALRQEDEVYSLLATIAGFSLVLDPEQFVSYRHHAHNASGFDHRTDTDTTEKRRIGRAKMNLYTWKFLRHSVENLHLMPPGLPSNKEKNHLLKLLNLKIATCEDEATWWECGILGRIRRSFFPAERNRIIRCPREWSRMLPRKWHFFIQKNKPIRKT